MALTDQYDVERKLLTILRILCQATEPVGARSIARELEGYGISLTERAVRYHLQIMDERGLTARVGREGRVITDLGREEAESGLVADKVGYVITRIKEMAFRTTFDPATGRGDVVMNTTLFCQDQFEEALRLMEPAFRAGLSVSDWVSLAYPGERLGNTVIPEGCIAFSTVCSVTVNGVLLKAGIPMDSRFGGILELRGGRPRRFVEIIHYSGSSLDPSEVFIRARMTDVAGASRSGAGRVLANFRELPGACRPMVERVAGQMKEAGINGLFLLGEASEPVCQVPVDLNMCGIILLGGLNPMAAAAEAGIEANYHAMNSAMPFESLRQVWSL